MGSRGFHYRQAAVVSYRQFDEFVADFFFKVFDCLRYPEKLRGEIIMD